MATYWTCEGSVRGGCGVRHRSEAAAQEHCRRDDRAVKRGNGRNSYSDRMPVEHDISPAPGSEWVVRLTAAQEKVEGATAYAVDARNERDTLIRSAIAAGVTMYRISQATGLSQAMVALIRGYR